MTDHDGVSTASGPADSTSVIGTLQVQLMDGELKQHKAVHAEQPTRVRWLVFALCGSTSFLLYLHRYTWGMIKPYVAEEFDWDYTTLSMLDSCFNLSYGIGQIPFGILGDWFGPGAILGSTILLWSLSMGAMTLATGVTSMYIARFTFGLMQAGCYSNLSKVTKVWFPHNIRTSVQGFVSSFCGRSGGAVSNLLFGALLLGTLHMPWRQALGLLTVAGLVYGVVFLYLFRSSPSKHPWTNAAEQELVTADDEDAVFEHGSSLKWSTALRSGNMWVFMFQQFTSAFADNLYPFWIPLFLLVEKGVDIGSAGLLASLPLFGGALGGLTGGVLQNRLIQKTGKRRWVRSGVGMTGKLLAAVLMFVSLGFDSAIVIGCLFACVKFFGDWSQPTVWGTATDIGGKNSATVFATVNMSGSIAGFVASPIMGALILYFSQTVPVAGEQLIAEPVTAQSSADTT
ncbi:MAG: MFS transporter, partial [Planctomycetaceae bacterium]